jgi:photosystem II stability/assembly factor-like uncharacterized protein
MGETSGPEAVRALALVVLALLVAGCASPGPSATTREYVPVAGFTDVHGIAVDPEDPDVLYVATHHGLIRGKDGTWERVGSMQDDLMGFSMHPDDNGTFWTSGHPRGGGNMGVRHSTDGGFTWTQLSLDGVDFHAMTVSPADPDVVWGAWRGSVYHSTDGARTWQTYPDAPAARSLTAHPTERDTLFATTQAGIERSTDAGRTWQPFAEVPAFGLAIAASDPGVLYAGIAGGVSRSTDGGATWQTLPLRTSAPVGFLAIHPGDASDVWAATYATGIRRTTDGGQTWTELKAPRAG